MQASLVQVLQTSPLSSLSLSLSHSDHPHQHHHNHLIKFLSIMWARFYCFLVLFVHILCLVGVSSRHFPPNNGFAVNNHGSVQNHQPLQNIHDPSNEINGIMGKLKEIKKIGSKPPSCEHKCYGCMPCEAIQVPTTTSHLGVLYTNYEPEGWKCKCGPIFYSP